MNAIITACFEIVIWGFVPAMSCVTVVKLYSLPKEKSEHHLSIRAGFWGGVILFLISFVTQVGGYVTSGFPDVGIYQGFNPFLALAAAVALLAFINGPSDFPSKYRGWLVLGLVALALWTFFHYLFIHTLNKYILSLALGVALGLFTHRLRHPGKHLI